MFKLNNSTTVPLFIFSVKLITMVDDHVHVISNFWFSRIQHFSCTVLIEYKAFISMGKDLYGYTENRQSLLSLLFYF